MQLHEMEEQLKTLDFRTKALEQILPPLATREDLEGVKRHAVMLNDAARGEIRLIAQQMATRGDLQELRRQMFAVNEDLKDELRREMSAVKDDLLREVAEMRDSLRGALSVTTRKK